MPMNLPFFAWFGVVAALFFIAAMIVAAVKNLVKPRQRIKIHRGLAQIGAASMLVHIFLALRLYF